MSKSASTAPMPRPTIRSVAQGSFDAAMVAMDNLRDAGFGSFKISVVVTRHNVGQVDIYEALAESYGAELRLTRLRPSGRGAETWDELHPTHDQQIFLYKWLHDRPHVLTGDSFFHLSALGEPLARAEPLWGGTRGLPHRSRRRPCMHARSSCTTSSRQARYWARAASPRCGDSPSFSVSCVSRRALVRAPPAAPTTPARVAAWRPSSSPASLSTDPTPECVFGHGADLLAEAAGAGRPDPGPGHSKVSLLATRGGQRLA